MFSSDTAATEWLCWPVPCAPPPLLIEWCDGPWEFFPWSLLSQNSGHRSLYSGIRDSHLPKAGSTTSAFTADRHSLQLSWISEKIICLVIGRVSYWGLLERQVPIVQARYRAVLGLNSHSWILWWMRVQTKRALGLNVIPFSPAHLEVSYIFIYNNQLVYTI